MERQAHTFDKDQPSELPGGRSHGDPDAPPPSFDEGEPRPSPIERTGNDGVRQSTPAPPPRQKPKVDPRRSTDATMPPGEGRDPKRHTL
jgi:hypothetical protein